MKIKTTNPILNLKGEPLKDGDDTFTVGQAISSILTSHESGGKMKLFVLAKDFYSKPTVEIDSADLALIKSAVESTKIYNALVSGQLLVMLESVKEDK